MVRMHRNIFIFEPKVIIHWSCNLHEKSAHLHVYGAACC